MVRDAETETIEELNENFSRKMKGLFLEFDSFMWRSSMTTSATVRCWRRWCVSEDHIRSALFLSCSCCDCVVIYSQHLLHFHGEHKASVCYFLSIPQLWSAGTAAFEDSEVLFFRAVSRAECAEWILFLCSSAQCCPALIQAVSCSPVGITMMRIKSWVLQRGTSDDTLNDQLTHLQFHSKLQWKATSRKCLFWPRSYFHMEFSFCS